MATYEIVGTILPQGGYVDAWGRSFVQHYDFEPRHLVRVGAVQLTPVEQYALALNRSLAGFLGMDPRYTISTNIARVISDWTGIAFRTAKTWFHRGVGGFVAAMLTAFGAPLITSLGAAALLSLWLERFDTAAWRQ